MSVKFYGKMWIATAADLNNIILKEKVIQNLTPTRDKFIAHRIFASLYARYVILCNNLGDIYDQTCQVQKRKVVRQLLEAATQRLLEMQNELKQIEMSEFIYVDQTLIEEKFIPYDVQLLRPFYYPLKRSLAIQNIIDGLRQSAAVQNNEMEENNMENQKETIEMVKKRLLEEEQRKLETPEAKQQKLLIDAINLIKRHEKARQSRCLLTNINMHPEKYRPQPPPESISNPYQFYHKDDQTMLIPVKKTIYSTDFHQELNSFSNIEFYVNPSRRRQDPVTADALRKTNSLQKDHQQISSTLIFNNSKLIIDKNNTDSLIKQVSSFELLLLQRQQLAANKIQKYWLLYRIKQLVKKRRLNNMLCLGMVDDAPKWDFSIEKKIEIARNSHRNKKEEFDRQFIEICEDVKAKILKLKSPWIMEDISDQIRNWFQEMYIAGGELDTYPPEIKGGTILVIRGDTKTPEEFAEFIKTREANKKMGGEQMKQKAEAAKEKKEAAKEKRLAEKEKLKTLEAEKKKQEEKYGKTYNFRDKEFITKAFVKLEQTMEEYEQEWRFIDEIHNIKEEPYMNWIELDKYAEIHVELRKNVDEFMRLEYEQLRMEWCKDMKKPYKPTKEPKLKKKHRSKRKKQPPKDTDDRPIEQIYDEMLNNGIIMSYPKYKLENYIGDINYAAYELRNYYQKNPSPGMGELTNILRFWLLGLGPLKQPKVRSICISGPPKCGKKFLAYAMASEIDAVMFNLSSNIVCKYKNDMKYLIQVIQKMSKILEPVVLFVDGAHEPFIRQIPSGNNNNADTAAENDDYDPRILGKYLQKLIKSIKIDDKIILIGTTNEPWNSKIGQMKRCYERNVLCYGTDYGTALLTWRTGIFNKYGVDRTMDFSALAKVTNNYTTGAILNNIDAVLNIRRRVRLSRQPLKHQELLEEILMGPPPNFPLTEEELEKYKNWFTKINKLANERNQYMLKLQAEKDKKAKKRS